MKNVKKGRPKKKEISAELFQFWKISEDLEIEGERLFKEGKYIPPAGLQDCILYCP